MRPQSVSSNRELESVQEGIQATIAVIDDGGSNERGGMSSTGLKLVDKFALCSSCRSHSVLSRSAKGKTVRGGCRDVFSFAGCGTQDRRAQAVFQKRPYTLDQASPSNREEHRAFRVYEPSSHL